MFFFFWGRCDFLISVSCRDMSRNSKLLGNSKVAMAIYLNNINPSQLSHDILKDGLMQWHPTLTLHHLTTLLPNWNLYLHHCGRFLKNFNGCGMKTMDAYSSGHLVQSHFRLAYMFQCWHQPFKNGHVEDFWVSNNPCNFDFTSQYFEVNEYTPWTVVLKHLPITLILKFWNLHHTTFMIFNISTLPWF